jgi:hypothetical protein
MRRYLGQVSMTTAIASTPTTTVTTSRVAPSTRPLSQPNRTATAANTTRQATMSVKYARLRLNGIVKLSEVGAVANHINLMRHI